MTASTAVLAPSAYFTESFTDEETAVLKRYFTNTTEPVFALINLPEVVKGALFSRYSRSPKSVRRLFLDEFYDQPEIGIAAVADQFDGEGAVGTERAEQLYHRVFTQYGDDSVAQLGGVHLACEQASNILTKVLEWGRLAAYLEQSTRYMFYDKKRDDRYRCFTPPEIAVSPLADRYDQTVEWLFDTYSGLTQRLYDYYAELFPKAESDSDFVYRSTIRAKTCDDLRGLLPAATSSNVGIYATGQAYEQLLLRMRAHPLAEARHYADRMMVELRKVIPAFLRRVDVEDRGVAWSAYLADTSERMRKLAAGFDQAIPDRADVTLVDWDPEAETKVAAAALYASSDLPDDVLLSLVRDLPEDEQTRLIAAYVGERGNRRHKPGRGMERADYRFDILCDYGVFRDLQRHRMMTLEWQRLGTHHGYVTPAPLAEIGAEPVWHEAMERTASLHADLVETCGADVAQYAVPFAYRIRFFMQMNAREAFHLLELRTGEGGHPDYRRVAQDMHRLIRDKAGHTRIADAMRFVDYTDYELERLSTERKAAARRAAAGVADPTD